MTQAQISLPKKTKAEILEQYQRLLENYEQLKMTAKLVSEPQSIELLERAREYTIDNLNKAVMELKSAFNKTLEELSEKMLAEAEKLSEIAKAVELSKKNLELHYNIQVAAETLDNLLAENKRKKIELEEEVEKQKRDWQRQKEEYDYNIKLQNRREEELFQEEMAKKEKEFKQRFEDFTKLNEELLTLRKEAVEFPKRLDSSLTQKEQEVTKRLNAQFTTTLEQQKKDWQAKENIYEMRIDNLESKIKEMSIEAGKLRQEAERASIKAQELAVKVIESGSIVSPAKSESAKT